MTKFINLLRRHWLIVPVLALVVLIVGGLAYLTGTLGITRAPTRTIPLDAVTVVPSESEPPETLYAQLDPAVIAYLDSVSSRQVIQMDVVGLVVQPIGAYLPRTGNTQFALGEPTSLPTPLPYQTATPLPLPYVERSPTPTPTESRYTEHGTPRTIPYTPSENECAPSGMPASGVLTQRFHRYHGGIDLGVPLGTPVQATHSGQITFAGWSDIGYGYLVILQNGAFSTYYAHNTSFNVTQGQYVGRGSIIAWSGSTGNSTGPHIHYEIRINGVVVDPLTFERRGYPSC